MPAPARATLAALWAALLVAGPAVSAQEIRLTEPLQLASSLLVGSRGEPAQFVASFNVTKTTSGYVGATPRPANPACDGCFAPAAGWITRVFLHSAAAPTPHEVGTLTRDHPLPLGELQTDLVYTLALHVQPPSSAVRAPATFSLEYVVAAKRASGNSSGGSLDASQPIYGTLEIIPQDAGSTAQTSFTTWQWAGGLALVAALGATLAIVLARRSRRRSGGR